MKKILFAITFLSPPFLKKILLKTFCNAYFGRGSRIGWFSAVAGGSLSMGDFAVVKPFTLIRCDGDVKIGKYTEIASFSLIYGSANFIVGDKCYLGPQSLINVTEDVLVGNEVGMAARTMIYTTGSFFPYTEGYWVKFGKVIIGNRVWLAAGIFIHPGIEIGNNVFVNSRSVVTKNVPSGKVMEGFPARDIVDIDKIRRSVSPRRKELLIRQIIKDFVSHISKTENNLQLENFRGDDCVLKWKRNTYRISIVGSNHKLNSMLRLKQAKKTIFLYHSRKIFPEESHVLTYFDFTTMKASYSKDWLFQKLYLFFKRYYGLLFEYDTK
jgi:acetyltransferase-like isoleucine patch superfamily enzyme